MARAADRSVECLEAQGFDRLFCVPGESYLALLDALIGSPIETVVCRHEGGAGLMAVADAKLTQRPLIIAGSGLSHPQGRAALARAAETLGAPVALTFKQQHIFDNRSPLYAGHLGFKIPPAQVEAIGRADLILALARRIADRPPQPRPDGLDFGHMLQALARVAPRNAILTMDAGNFSGWIHCHWPWDGSSEVVGAVGGAMGLGVPAAIAASLRHPGRQVIGFTGDGGALMTGSELATAAATGATPIVVISDNGTYGTIRLHQEKAHPGRVPRHHARQSRFRGLGTVLRCPGAVRRHTAGGGDGGRGGARP